jgi:hypothetical protein
MRELLFLRRKKAELLNQYFPKPSIYQQLPTARNLLLKATASGSRTRMDNPSL